MKNIIMSTLMFLSTLFILFGDKLVSNTYISLILYTLSIFILIYYFYSNKTFSKNTKKIVIIIYVICYLIRIFFTLKKL